MTRPIRNRLSQLLGELGVSASGDDFSQNVPNPAVGTLRESTRRGPWKRVPVVFSQSTMGRDVGGARRACGSGGTKPARTPAPVPYMANFRKRRLALSNAGW